MTKKDLVYISAILLLLTVGVWIGRRDGRTIEALRNEKQFMEQRIRDLEADRDTATVRAKHEEDKRVKIELIRNSEQAPLKAEIRRLKSRLRILPTPDLRIDPRPLPASDSLCLVRDSLIAQQDLLILSLDREKTDLVGSYERSLKFKDQQIVAEHDIGEVWRKSAESGEKKLRKERNKKRLWRFLAAIGLATAGVLTLSQ